MKDVMDSKTHSSAWIAQSWISFCFAITSTTLGLIYLPLDSWARGYLAVSVAFTISSTIGVSKTTRDLHEGRKLTAKVEEARVERLLSDHHPLK
ncbi:MAG: YiaA/YiaB family inner membrane protein [Leptolyngbyaceae cyanobacterium MO_188.B28]|nr:YiaA/YiaB family inner membrane protein [Leptolyngbyaceae cyanobacterium MO_188.B28]